MIIKIVAANSFPVNWLFQIIDLYIFIQRFFGTWQSYKTLL